jgi:uncharacterized membrane protein
MKKIEFILSLEEQLAGLPQSELEERLLFYSEMIDDRMDEGLSEEEAVAEIGTVDAIVEQIIAEVPLAKLAKEKMKSSNTFKAWEIILLAVGSPIWLSLGIAAFAVIFSLYISLWSVIISLWSVFASLAACGLGGIAAFIVFLCTGQTLTGFAILAAALVCAGLSIFVFFGCKAATEGTCLWTKKICLSIKKRFVKKEEKR